MGGLARGFNLRCRCFALMTAGTSVDVEVIDMFQSAMQMFCADDSTSACSSAWLFVFQSAMQMFCADDMTRICPSKPQPVSICDADVLR